MRGAATDRRQQLSAYAKAVDTLEGHFERVDYVVELAEWTLAHALPKRLRSATSAFASSSGCMAAAEAARAQSIRGVTPFSAAASASTPAASAAHAVRHGGPALPDRRDVGVGGSR